MKLLLGRFYSTMEFFFIGAYVIYSQLGMVFGEHAVDVDNILAGKIH